MSVLYIFKWLILYELHLDLKKKSKSSELVLTMVPLSQIKKLEHREIRQLAQALRSVWLTVTMHS